jgi:hypothetical protein
MAIIIKRRHAVPITAAPLAAEAVKAPKERTNADALADWKANHIPMNAKPVQCPYCKHVYLKPCGEAEHKGCLNFLVIKEPV